VQTGYLLAPSASWDGTLAWGGRTPPADPTRTTFKPAAHFGIVPFQDVAGSSGEFTIPVLAYCKGGIASVQFWCEGSTVTVTSKSKISEYGGRPFEAYKCSLDLSAFPASTNGPLQVYATITPSDGSAQARVISLTLYRDSGSAPKNVAYCGPAGNDTTGDGTQGNPYLTIYRARDHIRTAQTDVGGGTVYCLAGSYTFGPASGQSDAATANRWVTVMPAPGVSRSSVIITSQPSSTGIRVTKLRIKDFTIDQTTYYSISTSYSAGPLRYLWLDGVDCTGPGRTVTGTTVHSGSAWTGGRYVTDSTCTQYRDGWESYLLVRNSHILVNGADAFSSSRCVICSDAFDVDATGTAFHPDIFQMNGSLENLLLYGVRGYSSTSSQGIFQNGGDTATISDIAAVNCIMNCVGNTQFLNSNVLHWVLYNNTFRLSAVLIRDNSGSANTFNNFEFNQNVFQQLSATDATPAAAMSAASVSYNHFQTGSTFGTNFTTGTIDVDGNDTPTSSQLRPSGTSRLVVCDIWGNDRPVAGNAIGPVEAAAP
jgi:hypothetical protein